MRPLGPQIRAMLAASDRLGEQAQARAIAMEAGINHPSTNCIKLCRRAEAHGLMTVQAGPMLMFQVVPEWREVLERHDDLAHPKRPRGDSVATAISRARAHGMYAGLM